MPHHDILFLGAGHNALVLQAWWTEFERTVASFAQFLRQVIWWNPPDAEQALAAI